MSKSPIIDQQYLNNEFNLGWFIQNDQVSDEALCSALFSLFHDKVEHLASALLKSPADILGVVDRTFLLVISNRKKYKSDVSGQAWLYGMVVEECLAILAPAALNRLAYTQRVTEAFHTIEPDDSQIGEADRKQALQLLLSGVLDLQAEEIAHVLRSPLEQVRQDLEKIHSQQAAHHQVHPPNAPQAQYRANQDSSSPPIRKKLAFTEEDLDHWQQSILVRVTRQQKRAQAKTRGTQVLQACLLSVIVLASGWLMTSNWFKPSSPPVQVAGITSTPSASPSDSTPEPAPNTPTPGPTWTAYPTFAATSLAVPPAQAPDINAILLLADKSDSLWQSLWADVRVFQREPVGISSFNDRITRKQVWMMQPSSSRVISGSLAGEPDFTSLIKGNQLSGRNFNNGQALEGFAYEPIQDADLQNLFLPAHMFLPMGIFNIVGKEAIALRQTWILDWVYQGSRIYRYWVDTQYGVILRRQEFDRNDPKIILSDAMVISIFFNPPFSRAIFQPDQYPANLFAINFTGSPELPNLRMAKTARPDSQSQVPYVHVPFTAPSELNLSASPLNFEKPLLDTPGQSGEAALELFANHTYLGRLPIGGPAILACERSADGYKIAYSSTSSGMGGDSVLTLADLTSVQTAHPVLPGGATSGDFAFSPDGSLLAFYGCDKDSGFCGVFTLDTLTGSLKKIIPLTFADYILWGPDGRYLALVGSDDSDTILNARKNDNLLISEVVSLSQNWHFIVIDASSGDIVFKRLFEWSNLRQPPDSPTNNWKIQFKTRMGGIDGCTQPPSK